MWCKKYTPRVYIKVCSRVIGLTLNSGKHRTYGGIILYNLSGILTNTSFYIGNKIKTCLQRTCNDSEITYDQLTLSFHSPFSPPKMYRVAGIQEEVYRVRGSTPTEIPPRHKLITWKRSGTLSPPSSVEIPRYVPSPAALTDKQPIGAEMNNRATTQQ